MAYPSRNSSTYTLPNLNTGFLLLESGDYLLLETGDKIILEGLPTNSISLSSRNTSSYSLPSRN